MIYPNQTEAFLHIRGTQSHKCEITGRNIIAPRSYNFAHLLPKGRYPEFKYESNNIILVGTMKAHQAVDILKKGINNLIVERLKQGHKITVPRLLEQRGETLEKFLDNNKGLLNYYKC